MKLNRISNTILPLAFAAFFSMACSNSNENVTPQFSIDEKDKASLLFMLEEEKLARDIYTDMYELWGSNQFKNIKSSEQRHMNYVQELLDEFEVDYQIAGHGIFNNPDLQSLYNVLKEKGSQSQGEAFLVGASIEDIDIYDLQQGILGTQNQSIQAVYEKLLCGSNNHMRAFTKGLSNLGLTYTAGYISQTEYNEILEGQNGHCG